MGIKEHFSWHYYSVMDRQFVSARRKLDFENLGKVQELSDICDETWQLNKFIQHKDFGEIVPFYFANLYDLEIGFCCIPYKLLKDNLYEQLDWTKVTETIKFTSIENRNRVLEIKRAVCDLCFESLWQKLK